MRIRYINLDIIEPKYAPALWEFPRVFDLEDIHIFSFEQSKNVIDVPPNIPLDQRINLEAIDDSTYITRYLYPTNAFAGCGLWTEGVFGLDYHIPDNLEHNIHFISILKYLRRVGISCFKKNNDIYYVNDNKYKKFYTTFESIYWGNGWRSDGGAMITFNMNLDFVNKSLNKQYWKTIKRENYEDNFKNIIGGLWDIKNDLTPKDTLLNICKEYSIRCGIELYQDKLTSEEWSRITELANGLDGDEWRVNSIHPELGNISKSFLTNTFIQ